MGLSARLLPRYPKNITVSGGITKTETNGIVALGFDYTASELGTELASAVSTATAKSVAADASATSAQSSAATAAAATAAFSTAFKQKTSWDASAGAFPSTADQGAWYYVSTAGTVHGTNFDVGDQIVSIVVNPSTTVYAGNWQKIQGNVWSAVSIAYPPPTSAFIRIASNGTAKQYQVSQYGGGNGLWVYSSVRSRFEFAPISGSFQTIDTTSCSINGVAAQAMLSNTTYYVYAMAPDTPGDFVKIDHSTTSYAGGDPNGASNITGWLYRSDGHLERRLIGAIHPDASSVIWGGLTRGVTHSGITTYYNRQNLQYQIPIAGSSGATAWGEIDSTQYISAWLWGDGNEPSCVLAGQVSSDTSGATVSVGVSINGENPPYDFVDIYCAVAGKPYPFTVNVSSADYADEIVKFGVWMKNSSGNAGITNGRLKLHLSQ